MRLAVGSIAPVLLLARCAAGPGTMSRASAEADVAPTQGNTATGRVTFTQGDNKVTVVARISGLAPGGHGFHIREKGDCNSSDGMSAGGHFNPAGKPHGNPGARVACGVIRKS